MFDKVIDFVLDVADVVRYEFLGEKPEAPDLPRQIDVQIKHSQKEGFWWVKSEDYPGLYASGESPMELWENLNDVILTYFDVPRYVARKMGNPFNLPLPDGKIIVERRNHDYAGS